MEILFLIGRVLFGGFFVLNAMNHFGKTGMLADYAASRGVKSPKFTVVFSGLFILLGGLGVILGVWVQWAILLLALFLIPVSFKMHNYWTDTDPLMKMANMVNFTKNMALLGAALTLLAIPEPWVFSLF